MSASLARTVFRPTSLSSKASACPARHFYGRAAHRSESPQERNVNLMAHLTVLATLVVSAQYYLSHPDTLMFDHPPRSAIVPTRKAEEPADSRPPPTFSSPSLLLPSLPWPTLDPLAAFTAPARIQILLVPVHPIKRSKFEQYAQLVTKFDKVALAEVPPDRRGERAIFSSSPSTPGHLLFDYKTPTSCAPAHPLSFLADLQVHRQVQGIIGILDATEYEDNALESALAGFQNSLKDLPKTFATKVYGFDPSEKQLQEGTKFKDSEGMVMIPGEGDVSFFLKTLIADFGGDILFNFSNMAAQLESRTNIPTPQESPGPAAPFSFVPYKPNARTSISTYATPPMKSTPFSPATPVPVKPQPPVNLASLGIAPPPQSRTAQGLWGGSTSGNQDGFLYGSSIASNMTVQPQVVPSPPPGSVLVDQRSRKRVAGREKKLMGDMWLLSGRLSEAVSAYNEAISLTKAWQDQVWQASALEGLAVALVVQATQPKNQVNGRPQPVIPTRSDSPAPNPMSDISTFLSSIPDRLSQAVALYEKMLTPLNVPIEAPPPDPDRAHPLLYAEASLRCAYFLLAVYEAQGSMPKALERLVSSSPDTASQNDDTTSREQAKNAQFASLAPSNTVPRSSIALWISSAYSPHLATLSLPIRLRITSEVASLFGRIGYRRKEAFVLRELAALCAEGVAGRNIEVFPVGEGGGGRGPTGGIPSPIPEEEGVVSSSSKTASIVRTTTTTVGNDSIIRLSDRVCAAFGIQVTPRATRAKKGKRMSMMQGRALEIAEGGIGTFGWPGLQIGVLKDAIAIAESLPDHQAAIRFTVTALRTLSDTMPPVEQYELSQSIPRIFGAATRRGVPFELEYWGPTQLVMSLEVARLAPNRSATEHPLQDASTESTTTATGPRNPFIWDPRRSSKKATKLKPSLVQNEMAEVYVTLQNPFLFDLEIPNIELSTSGVPFAAEPLSTVVPPGSFHTVRLTGTPREPGKLLIRGCNIRLAGCPTREFALPVWDEEEETRRQKAALLDTSKERIKSSGLDAILPPPTSTTDPTTDSKFLECVVVPEQPLLWMRSTSLTHGALMLYDGEVSTIRIALENTSSSPIDFINLSFTDSLSQSIQSYLAENELPAVEAYELSSETLHRPVFTWEGSTHTSILPGASHVLEVKCLGKIGCGFGTIQIDYGDLDRDVVRSNRTFHTRQLFCDVFITVHRAVVAHSLDISKLRALPESLASHNRSASVVNLGKRDAALDKRLEDSLRDVNDGQHCLVAIDVMNVYGKPFEVKLERREEQNDFYQVRQRIEPGATLRMLVRLDRLSLTHEELDRPIPVLAERQFVVAKVKRSKEEERAERELFWYREELLSRIELSWNEVGSLRTGSISLRHLPLDDRHLSALRLDDISVDLFLVENISATPGAFDLKGKGQRLIYEAQPDEFIDVCCRVLNDSPIAQSLKLRLDLHSPAGSPHSLAHLARYVIIEGVSPISLPVLQPGESHEEKISICLLAKGRFEFGCIVEDATSSSNTQEQSPKRWEAGERIVVEV
ncbi:TRAPPII-specific subunit TRS120 [Sporobolomyces salmoneus]|uniref:TRAPPII-specific subunit TRS120 n=1 Tax=Sporobolomyces salmoneus TaxID=183962 RepID=UPI0031780EF6